MKNEKLKSKGPFSFLISYFTFLIIQCTYTQLLSPNENSVDSGCRVQSIF